MRRVLATVTGADHPGITSALSTVLARGAATLLDIEQVTVQGQLTLCLLLEYDESESSQEPLLQQLLIETQKLGLQITFRALDEELATSRPSTYALTLIGSPVSAQSLAQVTMALAEWKGNIETIRRLSADDMTCLEILVSLSDPNSATDLRRRLLKVSEQVQVDIALQRETLTRRSKRLVAMDMDSTLIQCEVIDELARAHGVYEQVANLTREAMEGRFDFRESLVRRVQLLRGLSQEKVLAICKNLPLTDGAQSLVKVLHTMGFKAGVISGGFEAAAAELRTRLNLDFAYTNRLEVVEGRLTGGLFEPIVTPTRKADLLETIAQQEGIPLEQTIAIGDGANDIEMIVRAGLGIAFHAKPKLQQAADTAISAGGLDRILYFLGLRENDIRELLV